MVKHLHGIERWVWITFGENRQATVTLADKLIVTDMLVILRATWLAVPKYRGTKASHMTQVVYMVNPESKSFVTSVSVTDGYWIHYMEYLQTGGTVEIKIKM